MTSLTVISTSVLHFEKYSFIENNICRQVLINGLVNYKTYYINRVIFYI